MIGFSSNELDSYIEKVDNTAKKISPAERAVLTEALNQGCKILLHKTPKGKYRILVKAFTTTADKLIPNTWNPNDMCVRTFDAVGESLGLYGAVDDPNVRVHPKKPGCFEIGDGEHRSRHMEGECTVTILFGISTPEFKKLTIVKDSTRGDLNPVDTGNLLREISGELDDLITGLPYEEDELSNILAGLEENPDEDAGDSDHTNNNEYDDSLKYVFVIPTENKDEVDQGFAAISEATALPENRGEAWGQAILFLIDNYLNPKTTSTRRK